MIYDSSPALRTLPRWPARLRRRSLLRGAGALSMAVLAAGCAREPDAAAPRMPRIALVMKSLANEFFRTMADGATRHRAAHAADYELIVNGIKNETDLAEQAALVEQMVAQGVQAVVIAPADSRALVPVLQRAREAGVLVINIDNKLDAGVLAQASLRVPFVGPDNRDGARRVGEVVAARLQPGDTVAIIEGIPTAFNGQQRTAGLQDAARAARLDVVSVQSGQWEMDKAHTIASALLSAHPDLRALLCGNDSMALGAVAAVQAAGRTGQVLVSGFDNISAVQPMLADGRITATADQHGDRLAVFGIEAALLMLAGQAAAADRTTPVDVKRAGASGAAAKGR